MKHLNHKESAFTAATNDIGNVITIYNNKYYSACGVEELPGVDAELEKNWGGHAGVSQLTARKLAAPEYIPEILGQHHGFTPSVSGMRATDEKFGGSAWQAEREK